MGVNLLDPLLVVPIVVVSAALYAFTCYLSYLKCLTDADREERKEAADQAQKDDDRIKGQEVQNAHIENMTTIGVRAVLDGAKFLLQKRREEH
eukprot:TRINITY_DN10067_c0_g3_i2.p2 TRINITY_DN10067_c0_g3~~TRINITY_DN10067_c0_g3_i2.p2  ORF type:complete len:106 (+),score=7.91 TRINITY_DN10067_c0_g3_i2:42-320(+)